MAKSGKGFKKDFDPPPSAMKNHSPSLLKSTPFDLMFAGWWLQSNPSTKTLQGAAWLMGFYGRLKEDELHPTNREYLKELVAWHEEKERLNCSMGDTQLQGDIV